MKTETLTKKSKKGVINMIRKYLIVGVTLLTFLFNVVPPAHAYVSLKTPVQLTASGTLSGVTVAFTTTVVAQGTTTPDLTGGLPFASIPSSGLADSGRALKITGGTNEVGGRIVIYTDNNANTNAPTVNPNTGVDGGGLVGETNAGYTVPLFWGVKSSVNNDPNSCIDYSFTSPAVPVESSLGNSVYIVDKRHTNSFTLVGSALDNATLYYTDGSAGPVNTPGDGLYPQVWGADLYDSATDHSSAHKVSPALYASIGTIAWGISPFVDTTTPANSSYVCNVPKLPTVSNKTDTVAAKLTRYGSGTTDNYLYVYIGADFGGAPAQTYSTNQLYVEILRD